MPVCTEIKTRAFPLSRAGLVDNTHACASFAHTGGADSRLKEPVRRIAALLRVGKLFLTGVRVGFYSVFDGENRPPAGKGHRPCIPRAGERGLCGNGRGWLSVEWHDGRFAAVRVQSGPSAHDQLRSLDVPAGTRPISGIDDPVRQSRYPSTKSCKGKIYNQSERDHRRQALRIWRRSCSISANGPIKARAQSSATCNRFVRLPVQRARHRRRR